MLIYDGIIKSFWILSKDYQWRQRVYLKSLVFHLVMILVVDTVEESIKSNSWYKK